MDANNLEPTADVSNSSPSIAGAAAQTKRTISDNATHAKDALKEFGQRAAAKVDESREPTARALENAATSLHSRADQFSAIGHSAADRLQVGAEYVRATDVKSFFGDLQNLVRRYPAPILAGTAILTFLVARGLSRSDR